MGGVQSIDQRYKRANQCCIEAADFIVRLDTVIGRTGSHGIAQQHASQTKIPAVLLQLIRQTKPCTLFGVEPPAHASAFDPAVQCGQVTLVYLEACPQGGDVEQIENFTDRETAVGNLQQVFDRNQQWVTTTLALVRQGEGDEAFVIALKLTEHGANVRRVTVDVRDHDNDVSGLQIRVGAEAGEQLIVQDFHFPLRTMGNVKAY